MRLPAVATRRFQSIRGVAVTVGVRDGVNAFMTKPAVQKVATSARGLAQRFSPTRASRQGRRSFASVVREFAQPDEVALNLHVHPLRSGIQERVPFGFLSLGEAAAKPAEAPCRPRAPPPEPLVDEKGIRIPEVSLLGPRILPFAPAVFDEGSEEALSQLVARPGSAPPRLHATYALEAAEEKMDAEGRTDAAKGANGSLPRPPPVQTEDSPPQRPTGAKPSTPLAPIPLQALSPAGAALSTSLSPSKLAVPDAASPPSRQRSRQQPLPSPPPLLSRPSDEYLTRFKEARKMGSPLAAETRADARQVQGSRGQERGGIGFSIDEDGENSANGGGGEPMELRRMPAGAAESHNLQDRVPCIGSGGAEQPKAGPRPLAISTRIRQPVRLGPERLDQLLADDEECLAGGSHARPPPMPPLLKPPSKEYVEKVTSRSVRGGGRKGNAARFRSDRVQPQAALPPPPVASPPPSPPSPTTAPLPVAPSACRLVRHATTASSSPPSAAPLPATCAPTRPRSAAPPPISSLCVDGVDPLQIAEAGRALTARDNAHGGGGGSEAHSRRRPASAFVTAARLARFSPSRLSGRSPRWSPARLSGCGGARSGSTYVASSIRTWRVGSSESDLT